MHAVESKHVALASDMDLFDEAASSQLAESVDYQGFHNSDDSYCSEGSALVYMAPEETKKFVQNLQMDQTEFLAKSEFVSRRDDSDDYYDQSDDEDIGRRMGERD